MNSKVFLLVALMAVLSISTITFAQQEEITLSTYYPAPYGEYDELCAEKLLVDAPSAAELQAMVRGDCHITRSLIVGTTGGGFSYDALNTAGTPLYDGDVIIEGSVGIGTTGPNAKLQINYGTEFVKQTALGVGGVTNIFLGSNTDFASGIGQAYFGITTGLANGVPLGGSATYHWGAVTSSDDTTRRLFHFGYFPDDDMTNNFVSNAWINGRNGAAYFAGNVGIGTTTPGAKLEVAGQVKITGGTPGAGRVLTSDASGLASWQVPPAGGSGPNIYSAVGTTEFGNVGSWTNIPGMSITQTFPAGKVYVTFNGTFRFTGSGVGDESSSVRIVIDGVAKIQKTWSQLSEGGVTLAPVTISWVESVSAGQHTIRIQLVGGRLSGSNLSQSYILTVITGQ